MRTATIPLLLLLCACPSSLRRPDDKRVSLTGTVFVGGTARRGDPLGGATITVTRASDGSELATADSSSSGGWLLTFNAEAGTRVVVAFRAPGMTPNFRALSVGPYTEAQLSVALEPPEPLECTDNHCVSAIDDAALSDVPDNLVGAARVFDPASETPRLVGLEPLRPLVVSWFQLDAGPDAGLQVNDAGEVDAGSFDAGAPFDAGMFPTLQPRLHVRVPLLAWRKLEDAKPGNAQLDVPFLGLDERAGTWTLKSDGWLETERGVKIPEGALTSIHDGLFAGGVVAVATVPTAGYWTVALPAASPGCLTGKVEAEGQSAEGALLSLEGAEPVTSKSDGTFCMSAPVVTGGTVALQYAGLAYSGGTLSGPEAAGTCGGTCTSVATLQVTGEKLKQAKVCKLTGTAVDAAGEPIAGAVVLGFDDSLGGNNFNTLCGKLGTRCSLSTAADAMGAFTLNLPILDGVILTSNAIVEKPGVFEASRRGALLLRECPTSAVQVRLLQGKDKLDPMVSVTAGSIAWTPSRPAMNLRVIDALGALKWEVESLSGFAPPVTYGQVPAGAAQTTAGTPAALAPGDEVSVVLEGTGPDGYQYSGSAAATIP
jgi:hypothetical protein